MYRFVALVALTAALVAAATVEEDFAAFKAKYNRNYATDLEEATALAAFRDNLARIEELKARNPAATFGVNRFADMTAKQFAATRHGAKPITDAAQPPARRLTVRAIPPIVNWVKAGGVTPVVNEGQCGSSIPFAAVANIEGVNFATNHKLVALSAQELIDCDSACRAETFNSIYGWLLNNQSGKIQTAASWGTGSQCSFANRVVGATITSFESIAANEKTIAEYVATVGPVAVLVDASTWQMYTTGVLTDCPSSQIDHASTIVGYNDKTNPPYWILKNSWGPDWGMEGYIYISKGSNTCGVKEYAGTARVKQS